VRGWLSDFGTRRFVLAAYMPSTTKTPTTATMAIRVNMEVSVPAPPTGQTRAACREALPRANVATVQPPRPGLRDSARLGLLLARDLPVGLEALHERYGPVVDLGYGPTRFTYVFGADANRAVLQEVAADLLWGPVLDVLVPMDGETALVVTDGPEHDRRRKVVQPAFHVRRIDGYLGTMVEEADRTIDGFASGQVVDVHAAFRRCVRRIVLRCLLGEELAGQADDLGDDLEAAIDYVQRPPTARFDRSVFPPYRRAMAARARADVRIHAEIERRQRSGDLGDDVLSWLLEATDDDGRPLTPVEVRDQAVSLIAAGYDTTSAAAGWTLRAVHDHAGVHAAVRDEVAGSAWATTTDLTTLPTLDGAVKEGLRLWPPGIISARRVARDVDVLGYRIPAGRDLVYSAWVTHRLPELFAEPTAFRPERWQGDDPGVRDRYAYVPFGGGARRCIGHAFATLELLAIVGAVRAAGGRDPDRAVPGGARPGHLGALRRADARRRGAPGVVSACAASRPARPASEPPRCPAPSSGPRRDPWCRAPGSPRSRSRCAGRARSTRRCRG